MKINELSRKERMGSWIVFGIYMIALIWLVLFKLADSIEKIPCVRDLNLIPFYYKEKEGIDFNFSVSHVQEVLDNVLIFIPVGFYFKLLFSKIKTEKLVISCFLLSLLFEISQFIFALGISDITDLLTNTGGGLLGMGIYHYMRKTFPDKYVWIANGIGGLAEMVLVAFFLVLAISS